MSQRPRGVTIYRPFDHEVPWHLLDEDCQKEDDPDLEFVRIAKREEEILGVYRLARIDAISFELVHLFVVTKARGQGVGWWLACHGLGLAEAKGGRSVCVAYDKVRQSDSFDLFSQLGFETGDRVLKLTLLPE